MLSKYASDKKISDINLRAKLNLFIAFMFVLQYFSNVTETEYPRIRLIA
ncbi:hypothetical protein MHK_004804, partial [Candidatus Magnetomorum sp. HK-1]